MPFPRVRTGLFFKGPPLRVERIVQGSPAEATGIRTGDLIREADGCRIDGFADFARVLNTKQPGDSVAIQVERNGQSMIFNVGVVAEPE